MKKLMSVLVLVAVTVAFVGCEKSGEDKAKEGMKEATNAVPAPPK